MSERKTCIITALQRSEGYKVFLGFNAFGLPVIDTRQYEVLKTMSNGTEIVHIVIEPELDQSKVPFMNQ